jgi:hypothetical protein
VTYGCEAWTLTNRDEKYLRIFERRILRKIFDPVQNEDGFWRIRMNHELNNLIKNADIVRYVKKKEWLGWVMRCGWKEKEYTKEYWSGNQWVGETEEDQGKDGLMTLKKI